MKIKRIILSVTCSLCAVLNYAQNVPSYVPTNGLFGSYTFYVNANGQSGNGNNCTVIHTALASDEMALCPVHILLMVSQVISKLILTY